MASHNSLRRMSLGDAQCSVMNNEYLIWEVLVRLPTKSLMRFKCVSKLWYSIIRNPKFAKAHKQSSGGGFHGFLITNFSVYLPLVWRSRQPIKFLYADLNDCPRLVRHQLTIHQQEYTNSTIVVNGLIGLYDTRDNFFTLCNIATHESINLPESPPSIDSAYSDIYNTDHYYLGYDPVDKVFKVLNLCLSYDDNGDLMGDIICHVFTLGVNGSEMKWRNIMSSPDSDFDSRQCMCINGSLYWLEVEFEKTLTRFQLKNETFQIIRIPQCIDSAELVEICDSPALLVIDSATDFDMWWDIWTMNSHSTWTRKRVLSQNFNYAFSLLNYGGTLPTGELVLVEPIVDFPLTIYIYDHLKTTLASIAIDGYDSYESQESEVGSRLINICHFEENIISLECLISKSTTGSNSKHKLKMEA